MPPESEPTGALGAPRHAVLFIHIQKTAGISLFNGLARVFGSEQSMRFARSSEEMKARYLQMSDAELRRFRLLSGHFDLPFWLRRDLGDRIAVSVIREPVERVLSSYRYMRSWPGHRLHAIASRMSPAEFVDFHARDVARQNAQCTRIAGVPNFERAITMARAHIDLLGTVEKLPLLTTALGEMLEVPIDVGTDNRSVIETPRREHLDIALVERLAALNSEDCRLWEYVSSQRVVLGQAQRGRPTRAA